MGAGLVTGSDLNFEKASGSRIENYKSRGRKSVFIHT